MKASLDLLLDREARRLAALADDAEERLSVLEERAEAAAEMSIPGPTPADLTHARLVAKAAKHKP